VSGAVVRLVCPLCESTVSEGEAPAPGHCPGCGARYLGDADSPPGAVASALVELDAATLSVDALASALFVISPETGRELGVAITSDARDDFYRWWLFLRADEEPVPLLERLLAAAEAEGPQSSR
jgi:hypothetical protein